MNFERWLIRVILILIVLVYTILVGVIGAIADRVHVNHKLEAAIAEMKIRSAASGK